MLLGVAGIESFDIDCVFLSNLGYLYPLEGVDSFTDSDEIWRRNHLKLLIPSPIILAPSLI